MIRKLDPLLGELPKFTDAQSPAFRMWRSKVKRFLMEAFGENSLFHEEFHQLLWEFIPPHVQSTASTSPEAVRQQTRELVERVFKTAKIHAQEILEEAKKELGNSDVSSKAFHEILSKRPRRIFISHGRSQEWMIVRDYISRTLKIDTLELASEVNGGKTIIEKLERDTDKCGFAVVIMNGDDKDAEGNSRVRENVMYEIGWFHARYGRENVYLLREEGASIPTNMSGIVYESFPKGIIQATFAKLREEIEESFAQSN